MSYARHETFYIRDGWLRKGLKMMERPEGYAFFSDADAPEFLGVGKNMVNSIRFWLRATGLIEQADGKYGLSALAESIQKNDPYFEDVGTWWAIHYHLVTDPSEATTWYWFFNRFNRREFDEETFLHWLTNYTVVEGTPIAESSLKKDFRCFVNTYLFEKRMEKHSSPEDNLNCPLRELRLLKRIGPKSYKLNFVNRDSLDPSIVYYAMARQCVQEENLGRTTIARLLDSENNIGKVFGLTYEDVIFYLESLQKRGWLTVVLTAGLDSVELHDLDFNKALQGYFDSREKDEGLWTIV